MFPSISFERKKSKTKQHYSTSTHHHHKAACFSRRYPVGLLQDERVLEPALVLLTRAYPPLPLSPPLLLVLSSVHVLYTQRTLRNQSPSTHDGRNWLTRRSRSILRSSSGSLGYLLSFARFGSVLSLWK